VNCIAIVGHDDFSQNCRVQLTILFRIVYRSSRSPFTHNNNVKLRDVLSNVCICHGRRIRVLVQPPQSPPPHRQIDLYF